MYTEILDPPPLNLEELLERRRELDIDRRDELWEGVWHLTPPASYNHERVGIQLAILLDPLARAAGMELNGQVGIGERKKSFRVPDLVIVRPAEAKPQCQKTAALVIEILSARDTAPEKLGFYAEHGVDEVLFVDPQKRSVEWLGRVGEGYEAIDRSGLIELGPAELAAGIDWP